MTKPLTALGLDLSLTGSGIASSSGWCKLVGRDGITTLPLAERVQAVQTLAAGIYGMAAGHDLIVIERPAFSRSGGGAVERHALWFLVIEYLLANEHPVAEVGPNSRALYATGKGRAGKSAVVDAVARRLSMFDTGGDDNLCDAAVLAAMGADHLGTPLAVMPAAHRKALDAVKWPQVRP
jgi:Holliday junction resolvasome RuvABC endonuclease subunit